MKKYMSRLLGAWLVGSILSLYTTFVIMNLWNWFASPALHVPEISFWGMFGLVLLVGLFVEGHAITAEGLLKNMIPVLIASVPDDRREEVVSTIEEYVTEKMKVEIWLEAGSKAFGRCVGNTLVLGLGFVVHVFLA